MIPTISPAAQERFERPRQASPSSLGSPASPIASWAGEPRSGLAAISLCSPSGGSRPSSARFKAHGSPWLIAMADLCCERCEALMISLGWGGLEEAHVLLDQKKAADFFAALRAHPIFLEAPSWQAAAMLVPLEALALALSPWISGSQQGHQSR